MNTQLDNQQFVEAQRRHHKGEIASALRVYDVLLKRNSANQSARAFRLLALAQLGKGLQYKNEAIDLLANVQNFKLPELIALSVFFKLTGEFDLQLKTLQVGREKFPDAHAITANLGNYYLHVGDLKQAQHHFYSIVEKTPDDSAVLLNLARIDIIYGNFSEAEDYLDKAEKITPGFGDIYYLRAVISNHDCDYHQALDYLVRVLKLQIAHRDAWKILRSLPIGILNEETFNELTERALKQDISDPAILFSMYSICRQSLFWKNIEKLEYSLNTSLERKSNFISDPAMVFTSLQTNLDAHKIKYVANQNWKCCTGSNNKGLRFERKNIKSEKIKVGYLSSDFRDHVVARNVTCVLEKHDRDKFEIYAYSNYGTDGSEIRNRLNRRVDQWVNIAGLTDDQLAEQIAKDGVDILVDLNGITKGTRASVFANRPAPVQITWNGMPGSLGASNYCDYIIVDQKIVDETNRSGFDERFIFLPSGCFPIDHKIITDLTVSKGSFGIPDGMFAYATFCTAYKYHPEIIKSWIKIAQAATSSIMLFLDHGAEINNKIKEMFVDNGILQDRLIFLPSLNHYEHLNRLSTVDCVLETWPYGAGGTCVDAIRVGVPIVTLRGNHYPSRMGSSVAYYSGLKSLIANDIDSYIATALNVYELWMKDHHFKVEFQELIEDSRVFEVERFVKYLERAYEIAFDNAFNMLDPNDILISPDECV